MKALILLFIVFQAWGDRYHKADKKPEKGISPSRIVHCALRANHLFKICISFCPHDKESPDRVVCRQKCSEEHKENMDNIDC